MIIPRYSHLWDALHGVLQAKWYLRRSSSLGRRVRVFGRLDVTVGNAGHLLVGERVLLISTPLPTQIVVDGVLEIGDGTFINHGCSIGATLDIRIGRRCRIGPHVLMMDNDYHRLEPERRDERPESRPIVLEENVWLGARAIVLRGVRIGEGSVVGAGSVVTTDLPPRSLAFGLPARVVRKL
jgi:maltose O-acetyltransferase